MTPDTPDRPAARDTTGLPQTPRPPGRTPSPDLQPEDAGTAASGQPDGGNTAEAAMKQTSKTPTEGGSPR